MFKFRSECEEIVNATTQFCEKYVKADVFSRTVWQGLKAQSGHQQDGTRIGGNQRSRCLVLVQGKAE